MKDIIIAEGRTAKTFYGVKELHIKDINEETTDWIPKDEANDYADLGLLNVTENGTYIAATDGYAGYSNVIVNVPTGAGGGEQSMFMDSFQTNILQYICTPNLSIVDGEPHWTDGNTHTFSCANTNSLRGLWIMEGTNLSFKEQHLVTASDYSALTNQHIQLLSINGHALYFTDILGDSTTPYQNYTFLTPYERFPDISQEKAEMYQVYMRKVQTEYIKANFAATEDLQNTTYNFEITLGTGTDSVSNGGKGIIKKDASGLSMTYTSRTDSTERGFFINDTSTNLIIDDVITPITPIHKVSEIPVDPIEGDIYLVYSAPTNGGA